MLESFTDHSSYWFSQILYTGIHLVQLHASILCIISHKQTFITHGAQIYIYNQISTINTIHVSMRIPGIMHTSTSRWLRKVIILTAITLNWWVAAHKLSWYHTYIHMPRWVAKRAHILSANCTNNSFQRHSINYTTLSFVVLDILQARGFI